ncbi:MAG: dolichol-phosphate mannosyltransferase [Actinomycetota bacterium]|nr:dolichol-phosphate mannosyltransferase [Actinomycetota bacterium]
MDQGVDRSAAPVAGVSVVVPTFNEAGNVPLLLNRLGQVAAGAGLREVVFVDDSTDDTPRIIHEHASRSELPVRLLHRRAGERIGGLSGAVVAGLHAARWPWVVVMDGDLQHPPEDVPRLLQGREGMDLVVASRYCAGGAADGLADTRRRLVSRAARALAAATFPRRLAECSDTMTGFFAVRRAALDLPALRPSGFKILLEILGRHQLRVSEVPFRFAHRHSGQSKAQLTQGVRFAQQLWRMRWDAWNAGLLRRVGAFALVGLVCLVIDVALFNALLPWGKPLTAKFVAATVAVFVSYVLNARWTWPQRTSASRSRQLALFAAVSGVGIGVAELCLLVSHYGLGLDSALADNVSANVFGLALGMLWRFVAYERWVFPRAGAPVQPGAAIEPVSDPGGPTGAPEHGPSQRRRRATRILCGLPAQVPGAGRPVPERSA